MLKFGWLLMLFTISSHFSKGQDTTVVNCFENLIDSITSKIEPHTVVTISIEEKKEQLRDCIGNVLDVDSRKIFNEAASGIIVVLEERNQTSSRRTIRTLVQEMRSIKAKLRLDLQLLRLKVLNDSLQNKIDAFDTINEENIKQGDLLMKGFIETHDDAVVLSKIYERLAVIDALTRYDGIFVGVSVYQNNYTGVQVKLPWKRIFNSRKTCFEKFSIIGSFNFRLKNQFEKTEQPKHFGSIGFSRVVSFINLRKNASSISAGFLFNSYYESNLLDVTTFKILASSRNLMVGGSWSHLSGFGVLFLIGID